MTIWGTYVFAKPLGRCIQALCALQAPENMPAMNNLIQTLEEYLRATDIKALDVFCKASGRSASAEPDRLTDEEILAILGAICGAERPASETDLGRFARAIEARVRMAGQRAE